MKNGTLGTNQNQRTGKNLLKNLFKVDDRTSEDLLGYIYELSKYINYYNSKNKVEGNWNELLKNDSILFITHIVTHPITGLDEDDVSTDVITDADQDENTISIDSLKPWNDRITYWIEQLYRINENILADKIKYLVHDAILNFRQQVSTTSNESGEFTLSNKNSTSLPSFDKEYFDANLSLILLTYRKTILQIQNIAKEYLWENIYTSNKHKPDHAIYITFVFLYAHVQKTINETAKKHLDFYFRDVLQLINQKGTPTQTVAVFDLQPTVSNTEIAQGTLLSAGKLFGSANEILFKTVKPLTAYQIGIERIQNLYFNKNEDFNIGISDSTITTIIFRDLIQNNGFLQTKSGSEASVFGADIDIRMNANEDAAIIADFGFVIGSPVLFLSEGERYIDIRFIPESESANNILWKKLNQIAGSKSITLEVAFSTVFGQAFSLYYTTVKGWQKIDLYETSFDQKDNSFTISIRLKKTDPAMNIFQAGLEKLTCPSIKFELNTDSPFFIYSFLSGVVLSSIKIEARVEGMKNLSVYNNMGKIALAKPFDLFGSLPQKNSFLMLGHSEWYKKQLTTCTVHINWLSLPSDFGGFETYYSGYPNAYTNDSFKVQSYVLSDGNWLPENNVDSIVENLFSTEKCLTPEGYTSSRLISYSSFELPPQCISSMPQDFNLTDPLKYTISSQNGFIKFTLTSPDSGFGGQLYPDVFTSVALYNAKNKTQVPYPNKPFVPKVDIITVDYTSSDVIDFTNKKTGGTTAREPYFIQLTPFGLKTIRNKTENTKQQILPTFDSEGYLILTLKITQPAYFISLYFHFLHSDPTELPGNAAIQWEYFEGDQWSGLDSKNIISDATNGFTKSGVIVIQLPYGGTEASTDIYTIRISPKGSAATFPTLGGIFPNAVEIVCTSTDETVIGKVISAGSITKPCVKIPAVKAVSQPADSSGGREAEIREDVFYTRVSERIRHSSRAVTIWDYERLVLDQFNTICLVKCTNQNEKWKPVPAKITVVVLSKQWSYENQHYLNVDELAEIKAYLLRKANSFVSISILNPKVDQLLVTCYLEFKTKDDFGASIPTPAGDALSEINEAIKRFISPLPDMNNGARGIGDSIIPQELNNLILNFPYVKSIKGLYVEHIVSTGFNTYSAGIFEDDDIITPSTPWSILLSVPQNNIIICDENDQPSSELLLSIGTMEIGMDFIIPKEGDADKKNSEPEQKNTTTEPVPHHKRHYNSIALINTNKLI
jgi:hypothetical protein